MRVVTIRRAKQVSVIHFHNVDDNALCVVINISDLVCGDNIVAGSEGCDNTQDLHCVDCACTQGLVWSTTGTCIKTDCSIGRYLLYSVVTPESTNM